MNVGLHIYTSFFLSIFHNLYIFIYIMRMCIDLHISYEIYV